MTPERWKILNAVFHDAVELEGEALAAHLSQACGGNEQLRRDVENLIAAHRREGSFIDSPALLEAAPATGGDRNEYPAGHSIGPYRVISRLGRGGMGEVYFAEDARLGRKVALKVLPTEFTRDAGRVRRFEQEARAVSSLNEPNIVTIHEIGRVDSTHYIVTEFVEGQTLRQLLTERKPGLHDAIEVAAQVASALAAAHAAGIVHRDIKPENLMVRPDGLVKVLDFGLAKLTENRPAPERSVPAGGMNLTEPGEVIGTSHYMSPEQARGTAVDSRSDIFSLGVVLYEMLAGQQPFRGATPVDVILSLAQEEPAPLAHHSPGVPSELQQIVSKALSKDQEKRYQSANELLRDLRELQLRLRMDSRLARAGGAVASFFAEKTRKRAHIFVRRAAIAAGAVILSASGWLWMARSSPQSPVIVVLPFENLGTERESDLFVDGLTDEIIRNLSLIEGMEVRSRTSSFAFKNKPRNLREIGEQLNTDFVLDGSVLQSDGKLRINAQFVRVRDDLPIWTGRFDRELKDIFAIQDEISRSVVNGLRLKLGRGERRYDTDPETYDLYLNARSLLVRRDRPNENSARSAELFDQVIARDPAFAPAYAGLADVYAALSWNVAPGSIPPEVAYSKIRQAAEKALHLDPLLAEAHSAMGFIYARDLDWAKAERAFRRATELSPNLTQAYVFLAYWVLVPTGRVEEALREIDKANRADPLSPLVWQYRGAILVNAGRYDEGIDACRRTLDIAPDNYSARQHLARALLQKGQPAEGIAILEKLGEGSLGQLGYAYAVTGRRAEAEALAETYGHRHSPLAFIYAGLGDKDGVFEALEAMAAMKDPRVPIYLRLPELALIRGDARLADLQKKVGLD